MANRSSSTLFLPFKGLITIISLLSLFIHHLSASPTQSHFEGFDADEDDDFSTHDEAKSVVVPPPISLTTDPPSDHHINPNPDQDSSSNPRPTTSSFDYQYWDEYEFEGIPQNRNPNKNAEANSTSNGSFESESESKNSEEETNPRAPKTLAPYSVEFVCVPFLIAFAINYFTGEKENEKFFLPLRVSC